MGKLIRLPRVMRRESLKKEEAASESSELEDSPASEKKGSRNVVCRFMNCWWKACAGTWESARRWWGCFGLGVWIAMQVGRPNGQPIEEEEEEDGGGPSGCISATMGCNSSWEDVSMAMR